MDAGAAYLVISDTPKLSVRILDTFFTRHIENRANAAGNAAVPLWDYQAASQALSLIISSSVTSAALVNGSYFGGGFRGQPQARANSSGQNNNKRGGRGSHRGGRGGGGRSGNSNRGGNQGNNQGNGQVRLLYCIYSLPFPFPPSFSQKLLQNHGRRTVCLRFNSGRTCSNIQGGSPGWCTRANNNLKYWHICALDMGNNRACGKPHSAQNHS